VNNYLQELQKDYYKGSPFFSNNMLYARWGPEDEASGFMENVVMPAFQGELKLLRASRRITSHPVFSVHSHFYFSFYIQVYVHTDIRLCTGVQYALVVGSVVPKDPWSLGVFLSLYDCAWYLEWGCLAECVQVYVDLVNQASGTQHAAGSDDEKAILERQAEFDRWEIVDQLVRVVVCVCVCVSINEMYITAYSDLSIITFLPSSSRSTLLEIVD